MSISISREFTAKHLGSGRGKVAGICLHDTAGSGKINDVKYLANPGDGRTVSVDFCVTREGGIYQLNPDLRKNFTYHAGRKTNYKGYVNAANNRALIGIEIVQKADMSLIPHYPSEQVRAVAELCAYLCEKFSLTKADITTHKQIITDGSRSDPRLFPFADFWYYFNEAVNPGAPGWVMETHIVEPGDTLYAIARKHSTTVEAIKSLNQMNTASNVIQVGQKLIVKR